MALGFFFYSKNWAQISKMLSHKAYIPRHPTLTLQNSLFPAAGPAT
jgi:hypothetical protein